MDAYLREEFNKKEAKYVFISPGLTTYLQQLDIGVNKEINQFMKKTATYFIIKNKNIYPSVKMILLICLWIYDIIRSKNNRL